MTLKMFHRNVRGRGTHGSSRRVHNESVQRPRKVKVNYEKNAMETPVMRSSICTDSDDQIPKLKVPPTKGSIPKKMSLTLERCSSNGQTRSGNPSNDSENQNNNTLSLQQKNQWRQAVDKRTGKIYFYDLVTRKSTWEKPIELCTEEEKKQIVAKKEKLRCFFDEMENNMYEAISLGQIPGGFHSSGHQENTKLTFSLENANYHEFHCTKLIYSKIEPAQSISFDSVFSSSSMEDPSTGINPHQRTPSKISPDCVSNFQKHSMTEKNTNARTTDNDDVLEEGIEMMEDGCGNLTTSHVSRSGNYSAALELGTEITIKCICIALRAHILESMIRTYEGTLDCSGTFDDSYFSIGNTRRLKNLNLSQLADPKIREKIQDESDILSLAIVYDGKDVPKLGEMIQFFTNIFQKSQMETDCIVMCLIYVERLMRRTHDWIRPTARNWRSIMLLCIMISSKVWDDLSMVNNDFANICIAIQRPISLQRINELELSILNRLSYKVTIFPKEFSKYNYFVRTVMNTLQIVNKVKM